MTRLPSLIFSASLLVACGPTRRLDEGMPCPCAPGWSCDATTNRCVAGNGGGGSGGGGGGVDGGPDAIETAVSDGSALPAFSSADVQTALAQCNLPNGPVASTATFGDKRAIMLGAWIVCSPSTMTVYSPAILFAADGTWNRLLSDGSGGLVVGFGVENQGTYSFPYADDHPTNGNGYVEVAAASGGDLPAEFGDGPMTFEMSPSRMHAIITYLDQTIEVWLVRLP